MDKHSETADKESIKKFKLAGETGNSTPKTHKDLAAAQLA
jgi:hypothetical protein